jgi:hypothetical protein
VPSRTLELPDGRTAHVEYLSVEREWIACHRLPRPGPSEARRPFVRGATVAEAVAKALGLDPLPSALVEACEDLEKFIREGERFHCPCCGYRTLYSTGMFEICPVCNWEDDPADVGDPDRVSGPNYCSLTEGRAHFASSGAKSARALARGRVRAPLQHERLNGPRP